MGISINPVRLLKEAIAKVPAVKYALGIAGVAAAAAIVIGLLKDYRVAVFGPIIMLFLMAVLAIFARSVKSDNNSVWSPASILTWSSLILIIATGALLLTAFFFSWPRPIGPNGRVDPTKITEMMTSLNMGFYETADSYANEVLEIDKKNPQAFYVKASVAFFKRDYNSAVSYFSKASEARPSHKAYIQDLALSYIEIGAYEKAIQLLKSVEEPTEDWQYETGRAYLFADRYYEALTFLQAVSTSFKNGRARILEAAALSGMARKEADTEGKKELLNKAKTKLSEGKAVNPTYWNDILHRGVRDVRENYEKIKPLLEGLS